MALDQLDSFMNSLGELESGNRWDAVGPYTGSTYGRARGRWQIMEKIYPAWAKEAGVKVMFAGDGGDELFAGNTRYLDEKYFLPFQVIQPQERRQQEGNPEE